VRMLRDHGQVKKYIHDIEGYNGRLDAMQAGFLDVKLQHLNEWNSLRRQCAKYYSEKLTSIENITCLAEPSWSESVYHLYVIRVPDRESVQKLLTEKKIGSGLHYPIPLHLQKAYTYLHYRKGDFPITEKTSDEILSLPMFPGLTTEQQDRVIEALKEAVAN
jgi:dTDP-4-amino-4,6-dideoxygalactose transaminase